MEVTWDPVAVTEEATRYYTHAEEVVAIRENDNSLHWLFSDAQGTGQITVDAVWGNSVQRRFTVFGEDRGSVVDWHGQRGFVGGLVDDSIDLTQLGARSYDALRGRFISVDPLLIATDSQQMHGYSYANNSPVTFSDPTGLAPNPCSCGKGVGKNPGKGKGTASPKTPNNGPKTGSAPGRPRGGGGGGGGWAPSGGGTGRPGTPTGRGPRGPVPAPVPYSEPDYTDPEEEALTGAIIDDPFDTPLTREEEYELILEERAQEDLLAAFGLACAFIGVVIALITFFVSGGGAAFISAAALAVAVMCLGPVIAGRGELSHERQKEDEEYGVYE